MAASILFFRKTPPFHGDIVREREKLLLGFLRNLKEVHVAIGYSLYDVPESDKFAGHVHRLTDPVLILSWQSVRATQILVRKSGAKINWEQSVFVDLLETENDSVMRLMREFSDRFSETAGGENVMVEMSRPPVKRWYPIIDENVCVSCLECVNYCLFGVYTIDRNNRPLVTKPDSCRDGCPACSRVCPAGAIIFPEYDDPVISGRATLKNDIPSDQDRSDKPKPGDLMDQLDDFSL